MNTFEASRWPPSRVGWTRLVTAALLAFVAAFALVAATYQDPGRPNVLALMNPVAPLAAGLCCLVAARRAESRREILFWLCFALGQLLFAAGATMWAWHQLMLHVAPPVPWLTDIAFLASYPLMFAAIMALVAFRDGKALSGAALILDGLMFAVGVAALTWQTVVVPTVGTVASWLTALTYLSYPTGDMLLLAALASLALFPRRGRLPKGVAWLAAALAVNVAVDYISSMPGASTATAAAWGWLLVAWSLCASLVGIGALAFLRGEERRRGPRAGAPDARWAPRLRVAMPYLVALLAGVILYVQFVAHAEGNKMADTVALAAPLLMFALVLARQLVVVIENHRLQASLAELSRELEVRVRERTDELDAEKRRLALLHEAASEISQCSTAKEVLRAGVRLAREAAGCDAAAVRFASTGTRPRLKASDGLARQGRRQLFGVMGDSPLVEDALAEGTTVCLRGADALDRGVTDADAAFFKSIVVIPLVSRRTSLGALCLAKSTDGDWQTDAVRVAEGIGAQIAVALENARRYEEASYLAERDPVTGLLNHRGMTRRIEQELARSRRAGSDFSIVMMDLDGFKLFNDTYGHAVGDQVLAEVARVLQRTVRKSDVLARYGGDEFLALLPDVDARGAMRQVERLQAALQSYAFVGDGGTGIPVVMSYGIATYPCQGRGLSQVLATADANLYRSKSKGGGCITSPMGEEEGQVGLGGSYTVLEGLVTTVDNKDHYTRRHSEDVCELSLALAAELGLSAETQRVLRVAGLLHDVGKIGVPDEVLRKPGRLTDEEFEAVKQHVILGELIIKEIPNLRDVLSAVACHHERYDGTGYPRGVEGERIPLLARILAVADAYSAMTTDRPYRKALARADALREVRRVAGSQLDPHVARTFVRLMEQIPREKPGENGSRPLPAESGAAPTRPLSASLPG